MHKINDHHREPPSKEKDSSVHIITKPSTSNEDTGDAREQAKVKPSAINPLNADCIYIHTCTPVSQYGMRIHTQLRSGGLVHMSIAIEEAPDNHRWQIHPCLTAAATNVGQ